MSTLKTSILIKRKLSKNSNNPIFSKAVYDYSLHLEKENLPTIFSLKHLSVITGIDYAYLRRIVSRNVDPYRNIKFKKRSGKIRKISSPHDSLAKLQKWILKEILNQLPLSDSATAFRKNLSIKDNAEVHCEARWLIKIDLKDFFHSIDEIMIYRIFRKLGYTALLSFELSRLLTRSSKNVKRLKKQIKVHEYKLYQTSNNSLGYLPQGASTSPYLANLVFKSIDELIHQICNKEELTYTRYADDIVISTMDKNFKRIDCLKVLKKIRKIIINKGFQLNSKKTQIIPPGSRKIVTGLIVNSSTPSIPKEIKIKVEAHLHFSSKNSLLEHCRFHGFYTIQGFLNYLKGLIQFCYSIDQTLGEKYFRLYDQLNYDQLADKLNDIPHWKTYKKSTSRLESYTLAKYRFENRSNRKQTKFIT